MKIVPLFQNQGSDNIQRHDINSLITRIYESEEADFWKNQHRKDKRITINDEIRRLKTKVLSEFQSKNYLSVGGKRNIMLNEVIKSYESPNAFYTYKTNIKPNFISNILSKVTQNSTPGENSKAERLGLRTIRKNRMNTFNTIIERSTSAKRKRTPLSNKRAGNLINNLQRERSNKENAIKLKMSQRGIRCHKSFKERRGINTAVLDKLIENCTNEENNMGKKLEKTNAILNNAIKNADRYKEVSKKLDKLSYASPNVLEYLYFMDKKGNEEIRKNVGNNIFAFEMCLSGNKMRSKLKIKRKL